MGFREHFRLIRGELFEEIKLFKYFSRTQNHASERILGKRHRQARTLAQKNIKICKQCATARENNAVIDDI
jgi:hypothetical protein